MTEKRILHGEHDRLPPEKLPSEPRLARITGFDCICGYRTGVTTQLPFGNLQFDCVGCGRVWKVSYD